MSVEDAWTAFVDGLRTAGERLAAQTADLDDAERADGYRSLVRALNNQLGRFEVDREQPDLVPFNGWRQKFFMDNPDFRYWVADIRDDRRYRITGSVGDAVYQSITAYARGGVDDTAATARIDSDDIDLDADGRFRVTVSRDRPADGNWLALPSGATALWVRQFHDDATNDALGQCQIEAIDDPPPATALDANRFEKRLEGLGSMMAMVPNVFAGAIADDLAQPNELRRWSEMSGGAAFTEPGIEYFRGSWELGPDDALVIDGPVVPCRYWNVILYSRFLNSLDHRYRSVSRTSGTAEIIDGRYRFVVARHPGGRGDWLDTEGRPFGLVVMRWLQPDAPPELPSVRRCSIAELGSTP